MYITEFFTSKERHYAVQGEQTECDTFRLYTLSLALGHVAAQRKSVRRQSKQDFIRIAANLSSDVPFIGPEDVGLLHQLYKNRDQAGLSREEQLWEAALQVRLSTLAVSGEIELLEWGTAIMASAKWVNNEGYEGSLQERSGAIALLPSFVAYEPPECQTDLSPERLDYFHAILSEHDTAGLHLGWRHRLDGPRNTVLSAEPDLVYGRLNAQQSFQELVVIPAES